MAKPAEELFRWLEERIEYYNYEYRYATSDKEKELIIAKRLETTEILDKVKDVSGKTSQETS